MTLLLELSSYLSILLFGLSLAMQSVAIGGVAYLILVALPFEEQLGVLTGKEITRRSLKLLRLAGWGLLAIGPARAVLHLAMLLTTTSVPIDRALTGGFVLSWCMQGLAGGLLALLANRPLSGLARWFLTLMAVVVLAGNVATTHAFGRLDDMALLATATAMHALGAAIWIGGLPYLLVSFPLLDDGADIRLVGRRYSVMSMVAVAAIVMSGLLLAFFYIGSIEALYGTAYGFMTGVKLVLFAFLLGLGAMNFYLVDRLRRDPATPTLRFRRFVEAELGIGLTLFFAAASLTAVPPGVDLPDDRVTLTEIAERIWPVRPRFQSPDHAGLGLIALQELLDTEAARGVTTARAFVPGTGELPPRNAQDIAWSEYNHNWAGVLVLAIGLLALAERAGVRCGRHWPLLFLVMAAFLFVRSDPEVWPLGPIGFFEGLRDAEVTQHRAYVLVIILFAVFEWLVRTGHLRSPRAALVFPLLTAFGGALLLTHNHAIGNVKEALLVEMSHGVIGLLGVAAGWSRWIELRAPGRPARVASCIWPICFIAVGIVLISYRETSSPILRGNVIPPTIALSHLGICVRVASGPSRNLFGSQIHAGAGFHHSTWSAGNA